MLSPFALLIPTRNAAKFASRFLEAFEKQDCRPNRMIVVDSESSDNTTALFREHGFEIVSINASSFDHGGTRQRVAELAADMEVLVYMTQDAILASPESLGAIVKPFGDHPNVGAVCGRQLPNKDANPFAKYARTHNYPEESYQRSRADFKTYGIKTAFMSNSFAAYRRTTLEDVGGFPTHSIFGEDLLVAAKMMLKDHLIRYEAEATVFHSHNYSLAEEFRRYFDIGVMRTSQDSIISQLGADKSQAMKLVLGEINHLAKRHPFLVPVSVARAGVRFVSYNLGKRYARLPVSVSRRLSFCPSYWRAEPAMAQNGN